MTTHLRVPVLAALLMLVFAGTARADGMEQWINTCSTGSLVTCASVRLMVSGTTVTLQVRNTSSGSTTGDALGYRGSVFYQVALQNVPSSVVAGAWVNMNGPSYGKGGPSPWTVTGNNSSGGGIVVSSTSGGTATRASGIASNCGTIGTNLLSGLKLWMSPQCGTTNVTNPTMNQGYTQITMSVDETWNPASTEVVINAIDEQGQLYQISTALPGSVTPEPVTAVLFGTGLLAFGGMGLRRRRKRAGIAG